MYADAVHRKLESTLGVARTAPSNHLRVSSEVGEAASPWQDGGLVDELEGSW